MIQELFSWLDAQRITYIPVDTEVVDIPGFGRLFTADLSGTCTGSMLVQHMAGSGVAQDVAVSTPSFFDMNIRLSYDVRIYKEITMQLYGGVQNLFNAYQKDFDKGVDRDSGYIYGPSLPRSWFVGAKFSF